MLVEHGHHVGGTTALKCQTELGWTRCGSAYSQMIREVDKVKRLEWARKNKEMTSQMPSSPMKLQCK